MFFLFTVLMNMLLVIDSLRTYPIYVAFLKKNTNPIFNLAIGLDGVYAHSEVILPRANGTLGAAYEAKMFKSFYKRPSHTFAQHYDDNAYDFLRLQVTPEEHMRAVRVCESRLNTPYDLRGAICMAFNYNKTFNDCMASSESNEPDIHSAASLFCSQSVVLVLRETLENNNLLQNTLKTFDSRFITPNKLYEIIRTYSIPVRKEDFCSDTDETNNYNA